MSKRKQWLLAGVAGFFLLGVIGMITGDGEGADPSGDPSGPVFDGEPEEIGPGPHYSVVLGSGATPEAMTKAAQEICLGKQWCQVMGWRDAENRARAMPMIPRESRGVAFSYLLNRASGTEKIMWDCSVWEAQPESCIAKDL